MVEPSLAYWTRDDRRLQFLTLDEWLAATPQYDEYRHGELFYITKDLLDDGACFLTPDYLLVIDSELFARQLSEADIPEPPEEPFSPI